MVMMQKLAEKRGKVKAQKFAKKGEEEEKITSFSWRISTLVFVFVYFIYVVILCSCMYNWFLDLLLDFKILNFYFPLF